MFTMYDSVDLAQIPAGPHAVACYVDGHYKNATEARKRFPHARILTLSTGGDSVADGYDVENGDYEPHDVERLWRLARDHGVSRPCFYAALESMPAVKGALSQAGIDRADVRLWVAAWDGLSIVPAGYDAKQFANRALGRDLDESVCADTFFEPLRPAPAENLPRAQITFDPDEGKWSVEGIPFGHEQETPGQ